jgi:hypothetical protein
LILLAAAGREFEGPFDAETQETWQMHVGSPAAAAADMEEQAHSARLAKECLARADPLALGYFEASFSTSIKSLDQSRKDEDAKKCRSRRNRYFNQKRMETKVVPSANCKRANEFLHQIISAHLSKAEQRNVADWKFHTLISRHQILID